MYDKVNVICGIYEIVNNVNGKKYIGQSIDIMSRWKTHQHKLNANKSNSRLLQRAWNKYGAENFSMNILEICDETMLDELEVKYINLYNTCNGECGYNIESGGNEQKHLAEETKQKLREAHLGKKMPDEMRKKTSERVKGEGNPMYGRTHTIEARQKISEKNKGKTGHAISDEHREKLRQMNLGKIVSEETRRKMSESMKGSPAHNKNPNPVYCVELNQTFLTPSDAGKTLGIRSGNIINCCEHDRKTCGGYHWIYVKDMQDQNTYELPTIQNECAQPN